MTVIARRIVAEPVRLATATWMTIVNLLAPESDDEARVELLSVKGIASSLIASEAMKDSPIVVYGAGTQVRFYCLYGDDAITGEEANEDKFVSSPVDGDWKMSLPSAESDLEWVQTTLKEKSTRITARDLTVGVKEMSDERSTSNSLSINQEAFFRS